MRSADLLQLLLTHEQWDPKVLCRSIADMQYPGSPSTQEAVAKRWLDELRREGLTGDKVFDNPPGSMVVVLSLAQKPITTVALLRYMMRADSILPRGDGFAAEVQRLPFYAQIAPPVDVPALPSTQLTVQQRREVVLQQLLDKHGDDAVAAMKRAQVHGLLTKMSPQLFSIAESSFRRFWRTQQLVKLSSGE